MKWVDNPKAAGNGSAGRKPVIKAPLAPPAPIPGKSVAPKAK